MPSLVRPLQRSLSVALAALSLAACVHADTGSAGSGIAEAIDARQAQTESVAMQLWSIAEVGYQETKSANILKMALLNEGFTVEEGVADIPTAFVGSWSSGDGNPGPVIAILAEFDALPGINQDAVPTRQPVRGKLAGHACGHNLFGAGSLTAALAIRDWLEETGKPGTIRLYGTPAEEGGSGKVYMVRAGLFEDVDFALHWHADDENSAAAQTTLANRSAKFRFTGQSAHAAAAPERGRSALDGVEAFNMMVNLMREHVPQDSRIHYVITKGGTAPNVVPDFAEVFYYVRHPRPSGVDEIWSRIEDAARGAALGTGTEVDWEVIHGNNPLLVNEAMAKRMDANLRSLGGITYTAEEQAFAETLVQSFSNPRLALGSEETVQPYTVSLGMGSTDVGDVSFAVPTVGVRTATWVPGTASHSWQAVAASGTSIGVKGAQLAAKAMALTAIDLYQDEAFRTAARTEFDDARGPDYQYASLLGDREPPLDYRR